MNLEEYNNVSDEVQKARMKEVYWRMDFYIMQTERSMGDCLKVTRAIMQITAIIIQRV